jgi:hypothetical protein
MCCTATYIADSTLPVIQLYILSNQLDTKLTMTERSLPCITNQISPDTTKKMRTRSQEQPPSKELH